MNFLKDDLSIGNTVTLKEDIDIYDGTVTIRAGTKIQIVERLNDLLWVKNYDYTSNIKFYVPYYQVEKAGV